MKQIFGIVFAIAMTLISMVLWGRVLFKIAAHPIYAFERLGLPVLCVLLVVWLIMRVRSRTDGKSRLSSEVARSVQSKSTKDQLEISINENGQWSDVAVKTARESFKAKPLSAQVDAVAELRANH